LQIDQIRLNHCLKTGVHYTRVEHLFGFMTNSMDAMHVRTIGIIRAAAKIALTNLTYNMMRCVQLKKKVYAVFLYDQYAKVLG